MSERRWAIGLDLGGSSAKIGLVSEDGELLAQETIPTPSSPDPPEVLAPFVAGVERLASRAASRGLDVVGLGCGVPGNLDPTRSRVLYNNVAALDGFALRPWLAERTGLPVALDNDACVAAVGETLMLPSHELAGRVLFVTVGSGIGVVLVVGGEVVRIVEGVTGDASHVVVDSRPTVRCPIGCRGCVETVASGTAIARAGEQAAREGRSAPLAEALLARGVVTAADVSAGASAGDEVARAILAEAGRWLGVGLASWAPLYAPDLVLVGGGVAGAGPKWLRAAEAEMREVGIPYYVSRVRVRLAGLGNRAGVVGAALTALRERN